MSESDFCPKLRSVNGRRVCQQLALLICLLLLPALASSGAPADSVHVQKSSELMSVGDLEGAEKEARLALHDASDRSMAWATLGAIRVRQKRYVDAAEFLNAAL